MDEGRVIRIGGTVEIPESELEYEYCHASGPGGQCVNTRDSAVQLRFNVLESPSLPEEVRIRLLGIAGNCITSDGVLLLDCQKFRQQARNRFAVREKLVTLLMKAVLPPVPRRMTGVPRVAKEIRMELKKRVSLTKRHRRKPLEDSEE